MIQYHQKCLALMPNEIYYGNGLLPVIRTSPLFKIIWWLTRVKTKILFCWCHHYFRHSKGHSIYIDRRGQFDEKPSFPFLSPHYTILHIDNKWSLKFGGRFPIPPPPLFVGLFSENDYTYKHTLSISLWFHSECIFSVSIVRCLLS
jgi:hypothetical protein